MSETILAAPPDWRVERVAIDHPDAQSLVREVQQLYVERYGSPDESPVEAESFLEPEGAFFVGYLAGLPVATGAWRRCQVAFGEARRVVEVKRMYVAPSAQRRGLARLLLAHLEGTAARAGADAVVLETGVRQPEAIALYASSGYGAIPGYGHYRGSPLSRCFGKLLPGISENPDKGD